MNKTGTDLIKHLGELAFATRLKRLAESLQADVGRVYREMNIDFEPKWFTMLYALYHNDKMSVVELASLLGLSHPAIIQFGEQMQTKKIVVFVKDKNDGRKKMIQLTAKGRNIFEGIEPVLHEIEIANRQFLRETGTDVLGVIERMEKQLKLKSMYQRVNERLAENFRKEVEIVTYKPELKKHFNRLNTEWLMRYFKVEPVDEQILRHPEKEILNKDGEIFFALHDSQVIGTCAVKKSGPDTYELLKMAVTEKFQSQGVGKMLLGRVVEYAKSKKAKTLELDTSRKLEVAMKLYESYGFSISESDASVSYERVTVKMVMDLTALFLLLTLIAAITFHTASFIMHHELISRFLPVWHFSEFVREVSMLIDVVFR